MRTMSLRFLMVILLLGLGLAEAQAVSVADKPIMPGAIRVIPPNFNNMVCVPEPTSQSGVVRLICFTRDEPAGSEVRPDLPSRNGSRILKDLYREREEAPWWQR